MNAFVSQTQTTSNARPAQAEVPCYDAEQLTDGGRQAQILLNEQLYTLRITRQGKLLLTK
ncbi:hemin uptake protein HemP [Rhodobacteraceae bacterium NNCM2]|nr:hemin uptake protein HemP [Coraliihabitans acroporae]